MNRINLEIIWDALHEFRDSISDMDEAYVEQKWDEICTQMAWIEEAIQEGGIQ